ncbi:MAG: BatA domain-containing protein [Crocinitomicaceae bacterium]|nr:BatA domain-containing protein [Crocinitomicaceae bacterium]
MKFEHPGFLFAFLLLAIPILIHLFNFRRYKTLYFSSLQFLKQVDQETKSVQKLKHLLVLITRILAFSALIIAFAQPYIPVDKTSKAGEIPVLAIYLDNSFSMTMKGTEGELISEAREQARKLINQASEGTRILLVTNEMNSLEQRLASKADAIDRLDQIKVSSMVRNTGEVLNWMRDELEKESANQQKIGTKQFVILSDFQKNSSDLAKLKSDSANYYYPIQFVPQVFSNIYIDSIWFNDPNFKVDVNNELNIRVKNVGNQDLASVELQVEINDTKRSAFVEVEANQETVVAINYSDLKPGIKKGVARINDKQLYFDDDYFFSYEVKKNASILIINGENAVPNINQVYRLDSYYQVTEVNENSITQDVLQGKNLVVINGMNDISTGFSSTIFDFVKQGGALALFPGEKINASSWNQLLIQLNMPTLGAVQSEGVKIKSIQHQDAFFKGVFEKKPDNLNLPLQNKIYRTNNHSKSNALNLIQLQNGSPLLVRSNSNYTVFLFGSSLAPSFGNLTSNALFSTIVLRMAEMSQTRLPLSLTIGSDSKFPIFKMPKTESPIHIKNAEIDFIPSMEKLNQINYISIAGPASNILQAGMYELVSEKSLGTIALNYNRQESDIRTFKINEVKDLFTEREILNVKTTSISQGQSLSMTDLDKPIEYWRIFLILAIAFLIAEMAIIRFVK